MNKILKQIVSSPRPLQLRVADWICWVHVHHILEFLQEAKICAGEGLQPRPTVMVVVVSVPVRQNEFTRAVVGSCELCAGGMVDLKEANAGVVSALAFTLGVVKGDMSDAFGLCCERQVVDVLMVRNDVLAAVCLSLRT